MNPESLATRWGLAAAVVAVLALAPASAHGQYGFFTWEFWAPGGSTSGACGPDPFVDGGSFCSGNVCVGTACFVFECTSCHAASRDALAPKFDVAQKTRHETVLFPRMALNCRGCHADEDVVATLWPKYGDAYARSHRALLLSRFTYPLKDGQRLKLNDGTELVRAAGRLKLAHPVARMETVLPPGAVVLKNRAGDPVQLFWRLLPAPGAPARRQ
jgi:hypothetical protein